MVEVLDRVPTYPGRVILTPVAGQANTYDMVRADEPVVEGTPLNKELFDSIGDDITALQGNVSDAVFAISQRTALVNVAVGTEIGLYENGILVPFLVLSKSYESTSRVLVVRKNCYKTDSLLDDGDDIYTDCKTDQWLNDEYLTFLDGATQAVITAVAIEVGITGMLSAISRKVFLVSAREYNLEPTLGRYEGAALSYFDSDERRIATFNGSPTDHYTRTISRTTGDNDAEIVTAAGALGAVSDPVATAAGIRPAFTLPSSYEVTVGVPSTANVMATAEVI